MLNSCEEIQQYMPHSGEMVVIDRVIDFGAEYIVTELDVNSRLPCHANGQVPAYFGIEVMAQSIAAWSGIQRANPNTRPSIGYLLGTRRYRSRLKFFKDGSILTIRANRVLENEGLAMFGCELDVKDNKSVQINAAVANISVYSVSENAEDEVE